MCNKHFIFIIILNVAFKKNNSTAKQNVLQTEMEIMPPTPQGCTA